jgi:hypothetical protein
MAMKSAVFGLLLGSLGAALGPADCHGAFFDVTQFREALPSRGSASTFSPLHTDTGHCAFA